MIRRKYRKYLLIFLKFLFLTVLQTEVNEKYEMIRQISFFLRDVLDRSTHINI